MDRPPWLFSLSLPSSSAPSRLPAQQETRGKLLARLVGSWDHRSPRNRPRSGHACVCGGGEGKSAGAIPRPCPHQLPLHGKKKAGRKAGNIAISGLFTCRWGKGVEARVGPMLGMGPGLAIGADEMTLTLSCFSFCVSSRVGGTFARRRVSGPSRVAGHIGAAFVRWDMPCRCRHTVTKHFVIHVLSCSYLYAYPRSSCLGRCDGVEMDQEEGCVRRGTWRRGGWSRGNSHLPAGQGQKKDALPMDECDGWGV
jgi:hypothetical protein